MLGVCLHSHYLTFAAATEEGDARVIDQTGLVEYPYPLTKKDLVSSTAVQDLIGIFRQLRNTLEFPANKSRVSLSTEFITLRTDNAAADAENSEIREKQNWESSVKLGSDTFSMLQKQQIVSGDGDGKTLIGAYFYPKILENIMEAAEFARLGVNAVDIGHFAAYDAVLKNYDISNYERHSLIHFEAEKKVSLSLYSGGRLLKFCRFAAHGEKPVFYTQFDEELYQAALLLSRREFDNKLYDITGPSFLHTDRSTAAEEAQGIRNAYFMELINPFINYEIFNRSDILDSDDTELNDNLFVEVAGTLFRGMDDHD